ncbi:MAG TPA: thioredoxin-disulfide reductase [Candidatus Thermoplasmatota archaeon]|nr:thioredoxin-disulfide reductase [Candidatus Thermoplasmatota archaeon]
MEPYDIAIVGSGPAGCTAAIYAARANLKTLVVAGYEAGGQLMITSDVENYPGFAEAITGPELMKRMRAQAERFGARFVDEDATAVDFTVRPFRVTSDSGTHAARTVIVATGSSAKWLGLPSETRLRGHGVSACATCDGFFFQGKRVVVVGGGDSAMEEALFLTKYATEVTIVHRRDSFKASKIMAARAVAHPKIKVVWDTVVTEILGRERVEGVRLQNLKTQKESSLACEGYFSAIGHNPNTALVKGQLRLDEAGYVMPEGPHETSTSVEGVFVAGDVFDHRYKQAVTAAGSGCKAAIDAEKWLEGQKAAPGAARSL